MIIRRNSNVALFTRENFMNSAGLLLAVVLLVNQKSYQKEYSSFERAIPYVLKNEGKLSKNKADRGGNTNYGISYKYLVYVSSKNKRLFKEVDLNNNKIIDEYDIYHMTEKEACDIYLKEWWQKYGYGKIDYQPLATKLFDMSVNMGPNRPLVFLRDICKGCITSNSPHVSDYAAAVINNLSVQEKERIIDKLIITSIDFYKCLAKRRPSQEIFLKGWVRRAKQRFN
jgi:lysozyme family protein